LLLLLLLLLLQQQRNQHYARQLAAWKTLPHNPRWCLPACFMLASSAPLPPWR
jgi:hypothetical protein